MGWDAKNTNTTTNAFTTSELVAHVWFLNIFYYVVNVANCIVIACCRSDDNVFFYGIFHGHDGGRVAAIAAQRFPADLLLGQVSGQVQDSHIIELIRQVRLFFLQFYFTSHNFIIN